MKPTTTPPVSAPHGANLDPRPATIRPHIGPRSWASLGADFGDDPGPALGSISGWCGCHLGTISGACLRTSPTVGEGLLCSRAGPAASQHSRCDSHSLFCQSWAELISIWGSVMADFEPASTLAPNLCAAFDRRVDTARLCMDPRPRQELLSSCRPACAVCQAWRRQPPRYLGGSSVEERQTCPPLTPRRIRGNLLRALPQRILVRPSRRHSSHTWETGRHDESNSWRRRGQVSAVYKQHAPTDPIRHTFQ